MPSDCLQRLCYDGITHSDEAMKYLAARVGADRAMLGDDFPFETGPAGPEGGLKSHAYLNNFEKRRTMGENTQGVLGTEG